MNLLSVPVLGAAAVVTAPALWAALVTGQLPAETAAVRYAVVAVVTWVALSVLALVVGPPPADPAAGGTTAADDGALDPTAVLAPEQDRVSGS